MAQEEAGNKPAENKRAAPKKPARPKLTLQQKFIKLREAIPAITQGKHSEGVQYKFAKIFDVYRLLTPIVIPSGLRVTGDFVHYFLTDSTVVLYPDLRSDSIKEGGKSHVQPYKMARQGGRR